MFHGIFSFFGFMLLFLYHFIFWNNSNQPRSSDLKGIPKLILTYSIIQLTLAALGGQKLPYIWSTYFHEHSVLNRGTSMGIPLRSGNMVMKYMKSTGWSLCLNPYREFLSLTEFLTFYLIDHKKVNKLKQGSIIRCKNYWFTTMNGCYGYFGFGYWGNKWAETTNLPTHSYMQFGEINIR